MMALISYGAEGPPVNNHVLRPQRGASSAPPDLAALIEAHGSYTATSAEAWTAHDAAVAAWRTAQIEQIRREQTLCNSQFRVATVRNPAKARKGVRS